MKIIYALGLAAAVVYSPFLHAQGCSGGIDGGMDSTGNQCNRPVSETAYKTMSVAVRPVELRGAEGVEGAGRARPLAVRPSKSPPPPYHATAFAIPVRHFAAIPATEPPSPKSAKIAGSLEATCSGGGEGGMDASGNQCSTLLVPAESAIATSTKVR